eukprot:6583596-Pyramimonas_sp.AAC.1
MRPPLRTASGPRADQVDLRCLDSEAEATEEEAERMDQELIKEVVGGASRCTPSCAPSFVRASFT